MKFRKLSGPKTIIKNEGIDSWDEINKYNTVYDRGIVYLRDDGELGINYQDSVDTVKVGDYISFDDDNWPVSVTSHDFYNNYIELKE